MTYQSKKESGATGTIMVADDTNVMRLACQRALERAGHRVVLASNGEEAISVLRAEDIDVALLDIKMPGLSGIDVLKTIKAERPLVEVIMMTAYVTQDIADEATQLGAGGFLTKPFSNIKTLTDIVAQAVTRKRLKADGFSGPLRSEDLLLKEGMVNEEHLKDARERAKEWNISIGDALVRMGVILPEDPDRVLAKALAIPFVRLSEKNIDLAAAHSISPHVARRYHLIPFLIEEKNIHVAVDDPFNKEGLEIVRRQTGLEPVMAKGFRLEVDTMILHFYPAGQVDIEGKIKKLSENADPELLIEILDSARALRLNKVHFEPGSESAGSAATTDESPLLKGRRTWSFSIEGEIDDGGAIDKLPTGEGKR